MCTYNEERFKVDVNIFVVRKKGDFHFALDKILTSYYFFNELILFVKSDWEKWVFFDSYKMVYPELIVSLKSKNN